MEKVEEKPVGNVSHANNSKKPRDEKKTTKILATVLASFLVMIVGLTIAIVAVLTSRGDGKENSCEPVQEITEDEEKEREMEERTELYAEIQGYIDDVIESTDELTENDVAMAYEYYIGEVSDTMIKNMLSSDLLLVEMGYDEDKVRGDELISIAIEIDNEEQSPNSAALVSTLANYYGRTDLEAEYDAKIIERETAEGIDPEMETRG